MTTGSTSGSDRAKRACADRVCLVTGAGRGLGREYALRLAAEGAAVVVNDLGAGVDGAGADVEPARDVVREITDHGGRAAVSSHDITAWGGAAAAVTTAVSTFGRLDAVVNNAGILRDHTLVKMTESDWDDVIRVHLKGTFAVARHAAEHWRDRSRSEAVNARLINTTSVSGLFGNVGQSNYAAAKAGIAALTTVAAMELERYGVRVNAVSPGAATRMTANLPGRDPDEATRSPRWPAAVVAWLVSPFSDDVTGQVFLASGKRIAIGEGWHVGPACQPTDDLAELDANLRSLLEQARPAADMTGAPRGRAAR